jgi:hypothetical protein
MFELPSPQLVDNKQIYEEIPCFSFIFSFNLKFLYVSVK